MLRFTAKTNTMFFVASVKPIPFPILYDDTSKRYFVQAKIILSIESGMSVLRI